MREKQAKVNLNTGKSRAEIGHLPQWLNDIWQSCMNTEKLLVLIKNYNIVVTGVEDVER